MRLSSLPILACCIGLGATLCAADYYVSPAGNDANAGTSTASPWRTVGKVNGRALAAGDRVLFQGGQTFADAGLYLDASDAGSAAAPIVIGSYGTGRATLRPAADVDGIFLYNTGGIRIENLVVIGLGRTTSTKVAISAYCDLPGGVKLPAVQILNCQASGWRYGIMLGAWHSSFSGYRDAVIDGCVVYDCSREGISSYGYGPASATQRSHQNLTFRNCEVHGVTGDPLKTDNHSGSGIVMSGTNGGLVDRCYAHHNGGSAGTLSGKGGPVGIWCYDTTGVVIQRCLVHDQKTTPGVMDGGGFDIDGGSNDCTIQYCYSYNNEGSGYLVCEYSGTSPLTGATVRYNISWNDGRRRANGHYGIHFYNGMSTSASLTGTRIHNNLIFVDNAYGVGAFRHQAGPIADVLVANNLFVVKGGARLVDVGSYTAAFAFRNNAYFATDGTYTGGWKWGTTTYTSLATWRGATGTPETLAGQPVGFQVDPLVKDLVAGAQPTSVAAMEAMTAFTLLAGSPMADAGVDLRTATFGSLAVGTRDFFANAIPQGSAFDVGPHETTPTVGNRAPTITTPDPAALTTLEDTVATVGLAATDADGDSLTWTVSTQGTKGAAALSGTGGSRTLIYTPNANANGADSCVVTVADGNGGSDTITVNVTITAVNDVPSFTKGANQTVAEDSGARTVSGWATAISAGPGESQTLTFQVTGNTNAALFSAGPSVASNGTLTFTPAANASGSATITLALKDSGGTANGGVDTSAAQSFAITVTAVNDPPVCTAVPSASGILTVGQTQTAVAGTWNDTADGGTTLGYAYQWWRADNATGTAAAAITGATSATYVLTGAEDGKWIQVRVTATDSGVGTPATASATVASVWRGAVGTPTNTPPAFTTPKPAALTTLEDTVGTAGLAATDADGDALTWTVSTPGTKGTAALSGTGGSRTLTYTPNANANGADSCVVTVSDGRGGTDTITVNVTIMAVNDVPSFTKGANQTVAEDSGARTVSGWATAISAGAGESQTLTFQVTGNTNPALFSAGPAVAANGTLSFTPAANTNGVATITLVLKDSGGTANGGTDTSAAQTFTVTVTAVNDAPVVAITIPAQTTNAGSAFSYTIPAGTFTDADGDALTWSVAGLPVGLTFTAGTRTISGTPTATGSTAVTVAVRDPATASASTTVTITVGLPAGWSTSDVGGVAAAGSATVASGAWTLTGSGADIWGTADEFRFASTTATGDVRITATVTSLTATNAWTKAGVMIRESGAAGSRHAFTCVTPGNGTAFQRRLSTGGTSAHTAGPKPSPATPYRVRLERLGNIFISSVSADGTTWREIRRETIAMGTTVQIGLALTSHLDGTLATAGFSGVEIVAAPTAIN